MLIENRSVNLQGGKNNVMPLDGYVEIFNRERKIVCSEYQRKWSSLRRSKVSP